MGRAPRIEYEGAAYHVMSRGNGGEAIYRDGEDKKIFIKTLDQTCERCGWEIHAYVLMGNHYHLLLVTPQGNLIEGMKWLQGTYTKRFNVRHQRWGHVLQGRYKAQNIDPESQEGYFRAVGDYIHLNPGKTAWGKKRAEKSQKLSDYPWSSLPWYLGFKRERPRWLVVERVLGEHGLRDDSRGRKAYEDDLEQRLREGEESYAGQMEDEIGKSWYVGSEAFRLKLLDRLESMLEGKKSESLEGEGVRDVGEKGAEELLKEAMNVLGVEEKAGDS